MQIAQNVVRRKPSLPESEVIFLLRRYFLGIAVELEIQEISLQSRVENLLILTLHAD